MTQVYVEQGTSSISLTWELLSLLNQEILGLG